MRYGLELPNGGACGDARTLGECAAMAEDAGWDGVFLEDYVIYQNRQDLPTYDPWVGLAAMAMRTKRIRLGTEVTPLPRRRPWKLARELVTLDHLSGGRMILGVGLGDSADLSFTRFGEIANARERANAVDESLEILAGLWTGEPFSYHGDHFDVEEVTFLPRPVQQPRIPIWVGGGYGRKGPLQRAARWDGACFFEDDGHGGGPGVSHPEGARMLKASMKEHRDPSLPFDIVCGGRERASNWDQEQALIAAIAEAGATWWIEWIAPAEPDAMRAAIKRGPLRIA